MLDAAAAPRKGCRPALSSSARCPGLNLKKIIALHDALRVESIADLKSACQQGLVSKVKGFGLKSQAKLLADIEKLEIPKDETLCCSIMRSKKRSEFSSHLRGCPELIEADVAGALRRRKETVRRIVIVAASDQPRAVLDQFLRFPALARTDELDESRCRGRLARRVCEPSLPSWRRRITSLRFTRGPARAGHVAKLRDLARSKGMNFAPEARIQRQPAMIKQRRAKFISAWGCRISRRKCAKMKARSKPPRRQICPSRWRWKIFAA